MPPSTTIDRATKVNIGILGALIAAVAGGAFHLSALISNVAQMEGTLREVKISLDRNTAQIAQGDKTIAILQTMMQALEARVQTLEKR